MQYKMGMALRYLEKYSMNREQGVWAARPPGSTCDNRAHTLEFAAKVSHLSGQEGAHPLFGEAFFLSGNEFRIRNPDRGDRQRLE